MCLNGRVEPPRAAPCWWSAQRVVCRLLYVSCGVDVCGGWQSELVVDPLDVLSFAKWCDTEPTFYAAEDFLDYDDGPGGAGKPRAAARFPLNHAINSKISLWCGGGACAVGVQGAGWGFAWVALRVVL